MSDDAQTPFDLVGPERDDAPHPEREPSSSCSRPACGPFDGEQARRLHAEDMGTSEPSTGAWTIPMICIGRSGLLPKPLIENALPIGVWPLKYFFANASLTMITLGDPARSDSAMSRPAISGVPIARK